MKHLDKHKVETLVKRVEREINEGLLLLLRLQLVLIIKSCFQRILETQNPILCFVFFLLPRQ